MSDYTVRRLDEVPDVLGDYPGEMRFFSEPLGSEQVAFTYRRMPAKTGGFRYPISRSGRKPSCPISRR